MKLTIQQVNDAVRALLNFNPRTINFKTKIRLNRNLRKLNTAMQDSEHDRVRLVNSFVVDQAKIIKTEGAQSSILTPAEEQKCQPELKKFMAESVDVDIHPIEIYSSNDNQEPTDKIHNIDISDEAIQPVLNNAILSSLLDVVFIEHE